MIETTLGWTVHSRSWLRHIEDQLSDKQKGVRDELGVLAIHTAFADRFFPGTSTQQTRLRYALFVPWLYRWLGRRNLGSSFRADLANAEVRLVGQLKREESKNVIGGHIYPRPAVQPPSMSYWTAVRNWGLLRMLGHGHPSRSAVHQILAYGDRSSVLRDDDGEPLELEFEPFYTDIPSPPSGFLDESKPLDFQLTEAERSFLTDRLAAVSRDDDGEPTLLARLAVEPESAADCDAPWDPRVMEQADACDRQALRAARRASHLAGIVRAAYAALVEEIREDDGFGSDRDHREQLEAVVGRSAAEAKRVDLNDLATYMPGNWSEGGLSDVLGATQDWLSSGATDLTTLRAPFAQQEAAKKGSRARLPNTAAAVERRVEWSFPLQGGLDYRWSHVKVFLHDLAAHE